MPGFGQGQQYVKHEGGGGQRQQLPEGQYRIIHTFELKDWGDGKGPQLQLKLVKADEGECCQWLSGGSARTLVPSEDGKRLEGEGQVSGRSRMAGYLNAFQNRAKLDDDKMDTLETLDDYILTIVQTPNTSAMAKRGSTIPTIVGAALADPPKASPKPRAKRAGRGGNGQADDVVEVLTEIQLQAVEALQSYVETPGNTIPDRKASGHERKDLVEKLKPFCPVEGDMQQYLVATIALDDDVVWAKAQPF